MCTLCTATGVHSTCLFHHSAVGMSWQAFQRTICHGCVSAMKNAENWVNYLRSCSCAVCVCLCVWIDCKWWLFLSLIRHPHFHMDVKEYRFSFTHHHSHIATVCFFNAERNTHIESTFTLKTRKKKMIFCAHRLRYISLICNQNGKCQHTQYGWEGERLYMHELLCVAINSIFLLSFHIEIYSDSCIYAQESHRRHNIIIMDNHMSI